MPALLTAGLVLGLVPGELTRVRAQEREAQIRVTTNLTLVEATVKDKRGTVLDGLTKDDFRVFEDGAEQKIVHFSRDEIPLAVAMVLDLSGSIEEFLGPLRYASMSSLKALKKEDKVALFTFTSDVELRVDLTHDKLAVSDEFESLSAGGGTNINDAVYLAAEYLKEQAPAARRVIILVSDNKPTDPGGMPASEVTRAVLEADAAVYGTKIPGRNPVQLGARFGGGLVDVEKLTEETGGEVFDVKKEGSMYVTLRKVIERLKTRYTIGYVPPNPGDGQFHKLDVELKSAQGAKGDYTIVSKKGYYATRQNAASR
ncbi:MAG: VWA domain-containing protein [Candidatus Acidiferrales bacterium]